MDLEETMVEEEVNDVEADDTLPDDVVEEPQDESEDLDAYTGGEEQPAEDSPKEDSQGTSEPGWIKKRVEKAVSKAVAQTRAEMQAMFDQQMAPIREKMLNDEARELVRQGEFKSLERAKEYLQLKQGQPVAASSTPSAGSAQPRQANGQYAPKEDPATSARIEMLKHQADRIKGNKGPDVIAEFQNNPEIKQKVINGEMDFYDVADYLKQKPSRRRPPSPMRSPNGASGNNNPNAIDSMSDEQFDRMEKRISEGARIRLSK